MVYARAIGYIVAGHCCNKPERGSDQRGVPVGAGDSIPSPEWEVATPSYDNGVGSRGSIGLITLSVDRAFVDDFTTFLEPVRDIGIFATRIPMGPVADLRSLRKLKHHLGGAATLLVPGSKLDVMVFGCTSGAVAVGLETVEKILEKNRPDVKAVTPIGAAAKALSALRARRISLLVPYHRPAANLVSGYFEKSGFVIDSRVTFDLDGDRDINRLSADALIAEGKRAFHKDSDALFISCTGLRTVSVIQRLEAEIGKPVVTSNQAVAWECLRLLGIKDKIDGRGVLFRI